MGANDELEKSRQYQIEHFAVKVDYSQFGDESAVILITHNGSQWQVASFLTPEEIEKTISELQKFIKKWREK